MPYDKNMQWIENDEVDILPCHQCGAEIPCDELMNGLCEECYQEYADELNLMHAKEEFDRAVDEGMEFSKAFPNFMVGIFCNWLMENLDEDQLWYFIELIRDEMKRRQS